MSARGRALLSALFWIAVGVVSYTVGVGSALGQRTEEHVLDAAEFTTDPPPPLNLVSELSIVAALALIGLVALAAYGWRRALGVTALSLAAIAASQLLKLWLLPRPQLIEYDAPNTFPSGHMTVFTVVVAALVWAVPPRLRALAATGGAVLLSIVGWQLLAYAWHRPSDVYGAIALGAAAFALAAFLRPLTAGKGRRSRMPFVMFMSASLLLFASLVMLAVAVASDNASALLVSGQLGAIGAATLASRTFLLLAERD